MDRQTNEENNEYTIAIRHEMYHMRVSRREFVPVNSSKPRSKWPLPGDKNYKIRPCNRGDDCNVAGCTFLHPRD